MSKPVRHRPPDPALASDIAAAYESGESVKSVALRFHVHRGKVPWIVREAGGTVRPGGRPGPGTDPAALAAAYAGTGNLAAAAARFGLSRGAARRVLDGAGLLPAAPVPPPSAELRAAYQSGMSLRKVAATFGTNPATVAQALLPGQLRGPGRPRLAFSEDEAAAIRAAYDSGLTLARCARKYGHSQQTTITAIVTAGGTMRPRGAVPGRGSR